MQCDKCNVTYEGPIFLFLAAIAALYVAMSVRRSVGRSVGVNEFQEVIIALKVYAYILMHIMQDYGCLLYIMHNRYHA